MDQKNEEMEVKVEEDIEEETAEKKVFKQDIFRIDYTNKSKILYQQASDEPDVKINNYLCCQ